MKKIIMALSLICIFTSITSFVNADITIAEIASDDYEFVKTVSGIAVTGSSSSSCKMDIYKKGRDYYSAHHPSGNKRIPQSNTSKTWHNVDVSSYSYYHDVGNQTTRYFFNY